MCESTATTNSDFSLNNNHVPDWQPRTGLATTYITGYGLGGANPAVNTPWPSRGTRIESSDFIVLIGDP